MVYAATGMLPSLADAVFINISPIFYGIVLFFCLRSKDKMGIAMLTAAFVRKENRSL